MKWLVWAGCCVGFWMALSSTFADTPKEAQEKLQGAWVATSAERDGQPATDVVGHQLQFKDNRFTITSKDGKLLYQGTFTVDPSKTPNTITFEHTEGTLKGKVWKGIYALDGDTLKTCDNGPNPDKERPTGFTTKADSGTIAIVFKRGKP
jgi:uncharacterized protein (TIGR03067 family)